MSRTYGGFLFTCKICGKQHLLDSGKPHAGILVPCISNKYAFEKYEVKEFTPWHGSYYDVCSILVQEEK